MGLDITAYCALEPIDDGHAYEPDACWDARHFRPDNEEAFRERASDLKADRCYRPSVQFTFHAGSYSGYNEWRNQLSLMAQSRPAREVWDDPTGPFSELINFSDCEGTIGPRIARKLAEDFRQYHAKAREWHSGEWFELYEKWAEAFQMAAEHGAVSFH